MLMQILNEYNIPVDIDGFQINVSDERMGHDRRIKIVGKGTKKGKSTCIPVKTEVLSFDELLYDTHTYRDNGNGTGKYLEFMIGFVILHHGKFISYFDAVSRYDMNIKIYRDAINDAFRDYKLKYKYNDYSRIRRDANEHVMQIRSGSILDT